MTNERNPADAVREALPYDWDKAHEALESIDDYARMDVGVAPYGPYAVLRDLLTKAKGWKEQADRLAALAGAAPNIGVGVDVSSDGIDVTVVLRDGAVDTVIHHEHHDFTHAPAKAREVTDADVARAVRIMEEYDSDALITFAGMRAALATFAEGDS